MLIPTPLASILTAVACKVVCDVLLEDEDTSPAQRVIRDHDTFTPDMARDMIREDLDRQTSTAPSCIPAKTEQEEP